MKILHIIAFVLQGLGFYANYNFFSENTPRGVELFAKEPNLFIRVITIFLATLGDIASYICVYLGNLLSMQNLKYAGQSFHVIIYETSDAQHNLLKNLPSIFKHLGEISVAQSEMPPTMTSGSYMIVFGFLLSIIITYITFKYFKD